MLKAKADQRWKQLVAKMREVVRQQGTILRDSTALNRPDFTKLRTGTSPIIELDAAAQRVHISIDFLRYQAQHFQRHAGHRLYFLNTRH